MAYSYQVSQIGHLNWFRLSRAALCRTLLSRLDGCGIWLNSLLLDVSPPSVCGIFRSGLLQTDCSSDCQTDHSWRCPQTNGGKMTSIRKFSHRPWPSSPETEFFNCLSDDRITSRQICSMCMSLIQWPFLSQVTIQCVHNIDDTTFQTNPLK